MTDRAANIRKPELIAVSSTSGMGKSQLPMKGIWLFIPKSTMAVAVFREMITPALFGNAKVISENDFISEEVLKLNNSTLLIDMPLLNLYPSKTKGKNERYIHISAVLRNVVLFHRHRFNNIVILGDICPCKTRVHYPTLRQHPLIFHMHNFIEIID